MNGLLQIKLELGSADPVRIEDALVTAGATAVSLEDEADDPLYETAPGELLYWPHTRISGLFAADTDPDVLRARLTGLLAPASLPPHEFVVVGDRDWASAWLRDFKPMRFGERLWVVPGGQPPPDPAACNVLLDPGLAFGTGTHATTALCLEWLEADTGLAGKRVIDYGCGSGILAVAAACLGAGDVLAVDNDPQALDATRANAARNGVAGRVNVCAPDGMPGGWQADRLVANILAGPLIALAPRFRALLPGGGRLALSGLIESQLDTVASAYDGWCHLAVPVVKEGWVRLDGHKVD